MTKPNKIPRVCKDCGTPFLAPAANVAMGHGNYCSRRCGRRRNDLLPERFMSRVIKTDYCWLWIGSTRSAGYGRIQVNRRCTTASRIAWELADGMTPKAGDEVAHTCDNPQCVRNDEPGIYIVNGVEHKRWGHLFLTTPQLNMADAACKNRMSHGENHHNNRIPDADVLAIRALAKEYTQVRLAEMFHTSRTSIQRIIYRKARKHI